MTLWFVRTPPPLGFVEVFKDKRPLWNDKKGAWVGRFIHPFSFRDAEALGMARWTPSELHGFRLVPERDLQADCFDRSPWSFVKRGRLVELHTFGMWTIAFCTRTLIALGMEDWRDGERMALVEIDDGSGGTLGRATVLMTRNS